MFAKRMFEPLMERMAPLSTKTFYKELKKWESVVLQSMETGRVPTVAENPR